MATKTFCDICGDEGLVKTICIGGVLGVQVNTADMDQKCSDEYSKVVSDWRVDKAKILADKNAALAADLAAVAAARVVTP